jgi:hypothetical protein
MNNTLVLFEEGKPTNWEHACLKQLKISEKDYVPQIKLLCYEHKSAWMT